MGDMNRAIDAMVAAGAQERRTSYYNHEPVSIHTAIDVLSAEVSELSSGKLTTQELIDHYHLTGIDPGSEEDGFAVHQALKATLNLLRQRVNEQGKNITVDIVGGYIAESLKGVI